MPLGASRTNFLPDSKLLVRNSGQVALATTFHGPALDLTRLVGYWNVDDLGTARLLQFAVNIEALSVAGGQSYEFLLEIDDNSAFSSATKVASQVISTVAADAVLPLYFDLNLERQYLLSVDHTASFVRLSMVPTGSGVAETGSFAFSAVAAADDSVTVNDGTSTVTFNFGVAGDGATGATVTVAFGATATDSAQNLKNAINANLLLVGVSASGAAATITVSHNYTGGALAKVDADNEITVVAFSGGSVAAASIKFWSFIRGSHAMGA